MLDQEILAEVYSAEIRTRPYICKTSLEFSPYLSEKTGALVYLKLENQQLSGSFKFRGALNKILSLCSEESHVPPPIVTASSGNHAAAVAYVLHKFGGKGVIYLPETVASAKVESLKPYGIELRFTGQDCVVCEIAAQEAANKEGLVYVSPYSDPQVIGGQGTIALELEHQIDNIDSILVPIGGGGLVSGIGGFFRARGTRVQIVGCQPENSKVMTESVSAGKVIELKSDPTLADGTAGGIDTDAITFPICQRVVDRFVLLTEAEIANAMRFMIENHYLLIEGAAALSVAALLKDSKPYCGQTVLLVVSGKKVSLQAIQSVISR